MPHQSRLIYTVDERPRTIWDLIIYSIQWVFIMFYGVIFAYSTIVVNMNLSTIEMSQFMSKIVIGIGISTLFQALFGHRMAMMSGPNIITNIALVTGYMIDGTHGMALVFVSFVLSGIIILILIRVGIFSKILNLWTNLVSGSMVLMVGLVVSISGMQSLLASGSLLNFMTGIVLALICGFLSLYGKSFISTIAVLITMILGYVIFTLTGTIDWSTLANTTSVIVPELTLISDLRFPDFGTFIVILLITVLSLINLFGNVDAYSKLVEYNLEKKQYQRSFYVFALVEIMLMALFQTAPMVPYGENLGFVSTTKNASKQFIIYASLIMIILGFSGKFIGAISLMPSALSGAVMLGVASSCIGLGIKGMTKSKRFEEREMFIVSISVFVALGLSQSTPILDKIFPGSIVMILSNGVLMIIIISIILEKLLKEKEKNTVEENI